MARGGRGRHTAKTGGKVKFFRKEEEQETKEDDEVFEREILRFDQDDDDDNSTSESSDSSGSVEGVLNIERLDDKEGDEDDDSSSKESVGDASDLDDRVEDGMGLSSEDDDDDDMSEEEEINIRDWGKRRSSYYNGDTADLELGQEEEDAFDEEEAAKEVQASRFKGMVDEDFMLSDAEDDVSEETKEVSSRMERGERRKDSIRDLNENHPELLPLMSHFAQTAAEYHNGTSVAVKAIFNSEEGTEEVSLHPRVVSAVVHP